MGCCAGRRVSCSCLSALLFSAPRTAAPSGRLGSCEYARLFAGLSASYCQGPRFMFLLGTAAKEGLGGGGGWGGCCVSGIKVQLSTQDLNLAPSPSPLVSLHALSPPSSLFFFLFFSAVSLLNRPSLV